MPTYSHTFEELTNDAPYYARVYTVNPAERVNNRADLPYAAATPSGFPEEPTEYLLIGTYTAAQAFEAPENGYFMVEVFGASGNGGTGDYTNSDSSGQKNNLAAGGGGGGGGYGASAVKLNKGDVVSISPGGVGAASTAAFSSTVEDTAYSTITVASGAKGGKGRTWSGTTPSKAEGGAGGAGGSASGGNLSNLNGGDGGTGKAKVLVSTDSETWLDGGAGGAAAYSGGNSGGEGAKVRGYQVSDPGTGSAGFIRIYRGSTNVVG